MDPMTIGAIAAPIVGGLLGNQLAGGERSAQEDILKELYAKYANLQIPDIEKQRLALEDYKSAGNYTAKEEATNALATHDPMQDITVDPRLRQAQMDQLQALSRIGETGYTPEELAQLNQSTRKVDADNKARLQQILQQADQRGMGSAGATLAAQLQASQSGANRQAEETENINALAFNRALQARAQAAGLGSQMENTQFNQGSQVAQALTNRELANFNQANTVQNRNVDRSNQAQLANLQNSQSILNQNTGMHNMQQQYNKELQQQQFNNQLAKLSGVSNSGTNLAASHGNNATAIANSFGNIGAGAGKAFGGLAQSSTGKSTSKPISGITLPADNNDDPFQLS